MVEISLVNERDVDELEALCRRAFQQVGYDQPPRCYTYDSDHIKSAIRKGAASPTHVTTKYVKDGKILGYMAVGLTDFNFYSIDQRTVYEIVWHGDPELPPADQALVQVALLKDMIGRTGEATLFTLLLDSNHLEMVRIIGRLGFEETGRVFTRRSPWAI